MPPRLNIPERSQDFTARQVEEEIVFTWTWPLLTTEGMTLTDVERFEVYGLEWKSGQGVPPSEVFERESKPLQALEGPPLTGRQAGETLDLRLPAAPLFGKTYALAVRGKSSRGRSGGFSNIVLIEPQQPPGAPGQPRATVEPDAIVLDWPAADRATAYLIERSPIPGGSFASIGRTEGNHFRDPAFQFGKTYHYRVTGLIASPSGDIAGALSPAVEITPADTFPPSPPAGLRAIAAETSVELSWQRSTEPDLANYRVWRAKGSEDFAPLQTGPLAVPSLSDSPVESGQSYQYAVSAVDAQGNESERSDPAEVQVP